MPLDPSALSSLIQTNVNANMGGISGHFPLSQQNPAYFQAMCTGIGTGIALGGPLITFTSSDTGFTATPPIPGTGTGMGIIMDSAFFTQDLYTRFRNAIISQFGHTTHDPYPPGPTNSGQYLLALCSGIADGVANLASSSWILASVDPLIYAGTGMINDGDFSGLVASTIQSQILAASPTLMGTAWPTLAQAISESYVATVEQHSTGTLTIVGICVPSVAQICNVPSTGIGTGTAA